MQPSVADDQEAEDATNQLTDSIADSDDEDCDESQVRASLPVVTSSSLAPLPRGTPAVCHLVPSSTKTETHFLLPLKIAAFVSVFVQQKSKRRVVVCSRLSICVSLKT